MIEDTPKVIDKSAIKAQKSPEVEVVPTNFEHSPVHLLEQLDIGVVTAYEGDVDLLSDELLKRV